MKNTRFEDPSGLSEKNISSADDLSRLIQYIYKSYPELVDVIHTQSYSYGRHTWFSNSVFTSDTKYLGGKNGYTDEARYTLVSMFKLPLGVNSEMHNVAIILLGSEQSEKDARALMLYLLRNVEFY
jgi:D-alanyl-D-alanine carboxypeptidase